MITSKSQTIILSVLLFYLLTLPLILLDYNVGRAFADSEFFHLPAIWSFTEQFDFSDYSVASTPGYHVIIAIIAKFFSGNIIFLKLVSSLITAGLIGSMAAYLHRNAGTARTLLLLLPMIFSLYFLPDGVWVVPDNLAWLTVWGLFVLSTTMPLNGKYLFFAGVVVFMAVTVRQLNLWLATVLWAAGLSLPLFHGGWIKKNVVFFCLSFLVTVPAFFVLWYFVRLWGGLVPPSLQSHHISHMSYCVPSFFLSVFFVYSSFYTPIVIAALNKIDRRDVYQCAVAGFCLGFFAAVIPETTYNYDAGRFSGFWNLVRFAPTIGHTSTLIVITSSLGGAALFSWVLLLKKEFRIIVLFPTLSFVAANTANQVVLERYFSGFIFILMFLILSQTDRIVWKELPRLVWSGPVLFAMVNLVFLYRGIVPGM